MEGLARIRDMHYAASAQAYCIVTAKLVQFRSLLICVFVSQPPLRFGLRNACLIDNVSTGVMGGVTSMDGFLEDYFPSVAAQQASVNTPGNLYCQYDSQTLQLMTSVLFISGAITEITGTTGETHIPHEPLYSWISS